MELNLDAVIETPIYQVDMKTGLDTFQGLSDATRTIVETILTDEVPIKKSAKSKVRSNMKNSFSGSYGLRFGIEAFDEDAIKRFKSIGKDTIVELIQYYLAEVLYENYPTLSIKAKKIVDNLEDKSDLLISTLRGNILDNIHKVVDNFSYDVKLRYRISKNNIREIQVFNEETASVLVPHEDTSTIEIKAAITRFNIYTGNGRLQIEGSEETIAFGFKKYSQVLKTIKRKISENLSSNTALNEDQELNLLRLKATSYRNNEGKVIKYWIEKLI